MKFVDELYQLYRNHLTGDEEDAFSIVTGVTEEFDRDDLYKRIDDLSDEQLSEMVALYVFELFRKKVDGDVRMNMIGKGKLLH